MPPASAEASTSLEPSLHGSPKAVSTIQQHTPPPDNYGQIKPCSHLKLVLETKAYQTVMQTYQQAVGISIAINPLLLPHMVFRLKKDGQEIAHSRLEEFKAKALRCSDCDMSNFYLVFVCLQCPHVGCYKTHAAQHARESGHMFAIDSHNGLLFCFLCGDYTNHSDLNKIRLSCVAACLGSETFKSGLTFSKGTDMAGMDADSEIKGYEKPTGSAIQGLKGIVNLGSTCFMSCILQTMLHNPLVRYQFFNNDLHFFNCPSQAHYNYGDDQIDEFSACVTCLIDTTFKEFFTSPTSEGYGLTNLLTTAWYKNRLLAGFQEQDAHEFWQFLLNEFHNDYERVASIANIPLEPCKCIMHSIFLGELESSIACNSCGSITKTVDPLVDLSLEINHLNDNPSLYDCLDQFTHNELLDVNYKCRLCQKETKAHKSLRIKKLSPVLSIQLKRFKHNMALEKASKIETKVDIPLFLNLTRYASDCDETSADSIDTNKVYELFAMVHHQGLVNTGHYVALVKNSSGQWFKFDDSVVSYASPEEVKNTTAYLLFYISHTI